MLSHDFVHKLGDHIITGFFSLESFLILTVKEFDQVIVSNVTSSRTVCDIRCAQFFLRLILNVRMVDSLSYKEVLIWFLFMQAKQLIDLMVW